MTKRLLFICSQNRLRSPTAEHVFAGWPGVETMSAGLNHDAVNPLSADLLEWADIVLVMEKSHRRRLSLLFGQHLGGKRVVVLNIADDYAYMQPELIDLLESRVPKVIGLTCRED